jgi:hypothetical protein
MPLGPGTYGDGGQGLAGPALQRQGIPEGVVPSGAPDQEALSEIMAMLQGGEVGAERFLQLLSLLAGSTVPQMDPGPEQQPQPPQDPMEAMLGGMGAPQGAPMGPGGGGQPSIADLLG